MQKVIFKHNQINPEMITPCSFFDHKLSQKIILAECSERRKAGALKLKEINSRFFWTRRQATNKTNICSLNSCEELWKEEKQMNGDDRSTTRPFFVFDRLAFTTILFPLMDCFPLIVPKDISIVGYEFNHTSDGQTHCAYCVNLVRRMNALAFHV